jgi:hypothetical protein
MNSSNNNYSIYVLRTSNSLYLKQNLDLNRNPNRDLNPYLNPNRDLNPYLSLDLYLYLYLVRCLYMILEIRVFYFDEYC